MKTLNEQLRADVAIITAGGSSYNSKRYSLKGVDKVQVVCAMGPSTGAAAQATTFTVVVGHSTDNVSAMSALTGATLALGNDSYLTFENLEEIKFAPIGTGASAANTFIINGTTWTVTENSCLGDYNLLSSANSALVRTLSCAIATGATLLEVINASYVGTAAALTVCNKDYGFERQSTGFSVVVSSNATADSCQAIPQKWVGTITFDKSAVSATNSSYTHFGIRANTAGTAVPFTAVVIRTGCYGPATQIKKTSI